MNEFDIPVLCETCILNEQQEAEFEPSASCNSHAENGNESDEIVSSRCGFAESVNSGKDKREEMEKGNVCGAENGAWG